MPPDVFANAVAVFKRIEIAGREGIQGEPQVVGQRLDFAFRNINGAGFSHTALAALLTLELNPLIKKSGALIKWIGNYQVHSVFITETGFGFNCRVFAMIHVYRTCKILIIWPNSHEERSSDD